MMTKPHRNGGTNDDSAQDAERLDAVRQAVEKGEVAERAQPLTHEDVKELREEPALAELAEVAEQYV